MTEPTDAPDAPAPGPMPLRAAISADFAGAAWRQRAALVGVIFWLVYEWGPGNETVTPWLLVNVVGRTSGVTSIVATAAVGFVFTTAQQLASGFTALVGFSMFHRTSRAAWARLRARMDVVPGQWAQMSWPTRGALVFGLGTTAVVLVQITSSGIVGTGRHRGVVVRSATLCGALVAVIGALGATLVLIGRRVHSLSATTNWIVRVLGNPLFWFGIVVGGVTLKMLRRGRTNSDATAR